MKKHLMVDLETMGTSSDAAIVSIGAIYFDEHGLYGDGFHQRIALESAAKYGRISPSTITWWLQQSDAARAALLDDPRPIEPVLMDFALFARMADGVWGNGATFDNVILRNAYAAVGQECPWHYRQDRCFRTLAALNPTVWVPNAGTAHNALDDAKAQALTAVKILYA